MRKVNVHGFVEVLTFFPCTLQVLKNQNGRTEISRISRRVHVPLPCASLSYSRFTLLLISACQAGSSIWTELELVTRKTTCSTDAQDTQARNKNEVQVVFVVIHHKVKNNIYVHIPAVLFCRLFSFTSTVAQRGAISQPRRMLPSCACY